MIKQTFLGMKHSSKRFLIIMTSCCNFSGFTVKQCLKSHGQGRILIGILTPHNSIIEEFAPPFSNTNDRLIQLEWMGELNFFRGREEICSGLIDNILF
jgi:hypothetical protein